jgi:hypothetical protein
VIALDRDDRRAIVILARETSARVTVPATALAQAICRPDHQARLARLIRQPGTDVVSQDQVDATSTGRLLAASGTADTWSSAPAAPASPSSPPTSATCAHSTRPSRSPPSDAPASGSPAGAAQHSPTSSTRQELTDGNAARPGHLSPQPDCPDQPAPGHST